VVEVAKVSEESDGAQGRHSKGTQMTNYKGVHLIGWVVIVVGWLPLAIGTRKRIGLAVVLNIRCVYFLFNATPSLLSPILNPPFLLNSHQLRSR
jgi:hypothetical protein